MQVVSGGISSMALCTEIAELERCNTIFFKREINKGEPRPVGGNLTNFSSNFEPSIACLKIAHVIFLGKNLLEGREGGKFPKFVGPLFSSQIFHQIFASHEPSFGPYKFVENLFIF